MPDLKAKISEGEATATCKQLFQANQLTAAFIFDMGHIWYPLTLHVLYYFLFQKEIF